MSGLIDSATAVMRVSSGQLDRAAINVANVTTPGFKRQLRPSGFGDTLAQLRVDMMAGRISLTGRKLDLAINGPGYFQLRAGDRIVYSRQGSFALDANGRVVTPQGYVLQQSGGGDLVLDSADVAIDIDGSVLAGDKPVGKIAVFQPADDTAMTALDGSLFAIAGRAPDELASPSLRQGSLESSNVSLGDEMVSMMAALRGAETGARLVQLYDDLMGRAITTFGQTGR